MLRPSMAETAPGGSDRRSGARIRRLKGTAETEAKAGVCDMPELDPLDLLDESEIEEALGKVDSLELNYGGDYKNIIKAIMKK